MRSLSLLLALALTIGGLYLAVVGGNSALAAFSALSDSQQRMASGAMVVFTALVVASAASSGAAGPTTRRNKPGFCIWWVQEPTLQLIWLLHVVGSRTHPTNNPRRVGSRTHQPYQAA